MRRKIKHAISAPSERNETALPATMEQKRHSSLSTSVSLWPVLYREFYFALAQLCTTSRSRFICRLSMSRLSFSAAVTHRISRGVFPPIYTISRLLLRLSAFYLSFPMLTFSTRSLLYVFPPFVFSATNGGTLVSIELGSGFHCLSQVRCFPFVKTWADAQDLMTHI